MSDRLYEDPTTNSMYSRSRARMPLMVRVAIAMSVLAGLLFLVPAAFYSYLNINPPKPSPAGGDMSFGDGTGFVIAVFFACPAIASLTAGFLSLALWRRGNHPNAKVIAALSPLVWLGFPLLLALWWR